MRLHRLVLSGVGPFAGRVDIDFASLGEAGLFLLEGPTGAGKSTIIDAVSFALFGKVAQASADGERLRSHFASPGMESFVELTWQCQAGIYRVRRTPKFSRPKRRGEGHTSVNPTVLLWRLSALDEPAADVLLSNRIDEAADEITHALGLSHAQFVQTVVLPQGEFASFLRSSSDEKRALLQRVFGTELLARVQAELVQGRQGAERARAAASQGLTQTAHAFAGAAGLTETTSPSTADLHAALADDDLSTLTAIATAVLVELTTRVEASCESAAVAETERALAADALQRSRDIAARQAQRTALRLRLAALQAGVDDEQHLADEVAAAERAAPVAALAQACDETAARHSVAAQLADAKRLRLPAQWRAEDELGLRAHIDHLNRVKGGLVDHVGREEELRELKTARRVLAASRQAAGDAALIVEAELQAMDGALAEAHAERAAVADTAANVELLDAEHDRRLAVLAAALDAEQTSDEVAMLQTAAAEALVEEAAATQRVGQLRQRRLDGIAAELGLTLAPDEPCPVCGALEHPAPARPGAGHVSEAAVEAAETSLAELSRLTTQAAEVLGDRRGRLAALVAASAGKSVLAARRDARAAATKLDASLAAARRLLALDEQLAVLTERHAELLESRTRAASEAELMTERLARSQVDLDHAEALLVEARAGFATVGERLVDIDGQIDVLDDAAVHIAASVGAQAAADRVRGQLDKALAEAGFDLRDSFAAAHRPAAALDTLRDQLSEIRAEWRAVTDGLAAPGLSDSDLDSEPPRLADLAVALAQAEERATAASAAVGNATELARRAQTRADDIEAAVHASARVFAETSAAVRVGYLVAGLGENQLRMDLSTYVLVRRFEQVVTAANEQLLRVSRGRYLLEHSDAKQGNARSGLGLLVRDLRTDRTRDPATLSGGETFYVSLSLALGLADVVRAESGGVDLGTLFIDEGFGSLDSEVLDEVLDVLDGLRAGGRVVGVVSHVSELKARIADRIEIRPGPDGSSSVGTSMTV